MMLRRVPPSLLFHRFQCRPRRIENARVMAPPGFLQPVLGRRFGLVDARCEGEHVAIPMRAEVGGQDRPGHVGETAREERRSQFDDVMLRLEPGNEM